MRTGCVFNLAGLILRQTWGCLCVWEILPAPLLFRPPLLSRVCAAFGFDFRLIVVCWTNMFSFSRRRVTVVGPLAPVRTGNEKGRRSGFRLAPLNHCSHQIRPESGSRSLRFPVVVFWFFLFIFSLLPVDFLSLGGTQTHTYTDTLCGHCTYWRYLYMEKQSLPTPFTVNRSG